MSFHVSRHDGSTCAYDLERWDCNEGSGQARALARHGGAPIVPIFCRQCFGETQAPSLESLVQALGKAPEGSVAVAGVTNHIPRDGVSGIGRPAHDRDLKMENVAPYYAHPDRARYMFQPAPGPLMYGHKERVGTVLVYWHSHSPGGLYLNALGWIPPGPAGDVISKYVVDSAGCLALSLGNYELGDHEAIAELSVVLVPGRVGCFGSTVPTGDRGGLVAMLNSLRYPPGGAAAEVPLGAPPPEPFRERLLEITADMMALQRDMLKIAKTYPSRSNAEKYINQGLEQYSHLTGHRPKLLTASMSTNSLPSDFSQQLMNLGIRALQDRLQSTQTDAPRKEPSRRHQKKVYVYAKPSGGKKDQRRRADESADVLKQLKDFLSKPISAPAPVPVSPPQAPAAAANSELRDMILGLQKELRDLASHQQQLVTPAQAAAVEAAPQTVPKEVPSVKKEDEEKAPAATITAGLDTNSKQKQSVSDRLSVFMG